MERVRALAVLAVLAVLAALAVLVVLVVLMPVELALVALEPARARALILVLVLVLVLIRAVALTLELTQQLVLGQMLDNLAIRLLARMPVPVLEPRPTKERLRVLAQLPPRLCRPIQRLLPCHPILRSPRLRISPLATIRPCRSPRSLRHLLQISRHKQICRHLEVQRPLLLLICLRSLRAI